MYGQPNLSTVFSGRTLIFYLRLVPKTKIRRLSSDSLDAEKNVRLTTINHASLKNACKILILKLDGRQESTSLHSTMKHRY